MSAEIYDELPFWKRKKLSEMNSEEWESLCDGCARCCLIKFQDPDTGEILHTNVVCRLLDIHRCRCTAYAERTRLVPTCIQVTEEAARTLNWMPETCAYRLLAEGKDLYPWHPLVAGNSRAMHRAGISVRDKVISEADIDPDHLEDFIID